MANEFFQNVSTKNPNLVMGFNSVGAFSSINHLHFQIVDIGQFSSSLLIHKPDIIGETEDLNASDVWSKIDKLNQ